MKRGISLLVVLCLLVSLCSTIFVNAAPPAQKVTETEAAAPDAQISNEPITESSLPELDKVDITINGLGIGKNIADVTAETTNIDATCAVRIFDDDTREEAQGTFRNGHVYEIRVDVDSDTNIFSEETELTINGREMLNCYTEMSHLYGYYYVSYLPHIEQVEITVPEPAIGQPLGVPTVPENANYEMDWYSWVKEDESSATEDVQAGEIVQTGYTYYLHCGLRPKEGYDFAENVEATINGGAVIWPGVSDDFRYYACGRWWSFDRFPWVFFESSNLPEVLEPGPAPQVELSTDEENVAVTEAYWTDRDGNRVTAFEENMLYYLNVTVVTQNGYEFADDAYVYINHMSQDTYMVTKDTFFGKWRRDDLLPIAKEVEITLSGTQIGDNIADVSAVVTNLDNIDLDVLIYDVAEDAEVTEGTFQNGKGYLIWMMLTSDHYIFTFDETEVTLIGGTIDRLTGFGDFLAGVRCYISYMPHIDKIELTVPEPVIGQEPGAPTVPDGVDYYIGKYYWIDETTDEEMQPGETFQDKHAYGLRYRIYPNKGYDFAKSGTTYVNGEFAFSWESKSYNFEYRTGSWYWSFELPKIYEVMLTDNQPDQIAPGPAPQVELGVLAGNATVTDTYWTDKDGNRVTAFEDGKLYYLNVALVAAEGYRFYENTSIYSDNYNYGEFELVDYTDNTCIARSCYYTLLPVANKVDITITGVELGKPVADVVVQVTTPDMKIDHLRIIDYDPWEEATGVFAQGKSYEISIDVISDNYAFDDNTVVTINGEECDYYSDGNRVLTNYYVSFKTHVDKVEISVPQPVAGQEPGAPTVSADAGYVIEYYEWFDEKNREYLEQGDKFQNGGRYSLVFSVFAKDGYDFTAETTVTVNGQKADKRGSGDYDTYFWGEQTWSLAKPIQKIELPAIPDKIKPGAAPKINPIEKTEYTVTGYWMDVEKNEPVTTFKDGGSYILVYNVEPKPGYELDMENTKVLAGGKDYTGIWSGGYDAAFAGKVFSLSKKVVDRIDLTITAPALGQKPAEITAAQSDKYGLMYKAWLEGDTGSIHDNPRHMDGRFTTGKYYFAEVQITAKNGYMITEDTQVYINGDKVNPSVFWAMGSSAMVTQIYQPLGDSAGDMTGDGTVNNKDVEYLLWHTLFPANYPISKNVDFNGDGTVNNKDVEYLLWHTLFPGNYPLNK